MAAEPGGTRLADQQPRFDGGLNDVSDDAAGQDNQMRRAFNARLTDYGAVTKRGGTQRTSTAALAAASVLNGFTFRQDSGTRQILAVCNGTLRTTTYGSFPWTWASQTGTFSTTVVPTFAQFRDAGGNDVVYIADGGLLNKWNGTALTTNIANTTDCAVIAVHNERLWGTVNSTYPDSIFYSALNNGDTLGYGPSDGGQIIVRTFGDEAIVGLASINTSLLIFHRRGISRLTGFGQDDITTQPAGLTADVGTIAAKSIVANNNIAFFISERGLYRCNEAEVAPVGTPTKPDPILPIIRQLSSANFDKIRAVLNRATKELWITIPGYGCYQYHTVLDSWSGPWDGGYISPDTTALFETALMWMSYHAMGYLAFFGQGDPLGRELVALRGGAVDELDRLAGPVDAEPCDLVAGADQPPQGGHLADDACVVAGVRRRRDERGHRASSKERAHHSISALRVKPVAVRTWPSSSWITLMAALISWLSCT